ncbi:MAG: hypothetical protein NTU53_11800 [Planctomycetota bacterium]|nr:hypothetical protein [Planctomycetota bacterium]
MTELLRQALMQADNKYAVTKATGVPKASLIRFLRGDQSLRLDMADRLAAYLGIECIRRNDMETGRPSSARAGTGAPGSSPTCRREPVRARCSCR